MPSARSARGSRPTKPLIDKLGVRPGDLVSVLGVEDPAFRRALAARTDDVHDGRAAAGSDWIFLLAPTTAALKRLPALRKRIHQAGAIWVVAPKGKGGLGYQPVLAGAKAAGLVDVKVVGFSKTHTALKLVIPVALRKQKTSRATYLRAGRC